MKKRFVKTVLAGMIMILSLSACSLPEVQIFKKNLNGDELEPLSDTELKDDVYYVKDNTKFYEVHTPEGGNVGTASPSSLDVSRIACVCKMENKIPLHYQGELVAYSSDDKMLEEVILERYKDLGYSIGFFGATRTEDGYLQFNKDRNIIEDSSLDEVLSARTAEDIRIKSINGKDLTLDNINLQTGCIVGLEKYKDYTIGYYAGTKYYEDTVNADTLMLQAYEYYSFGKETLEDTPNGYVCFKTPEDLKSGYYNINGGGIFKYYDHERGFDTAGIDMNESYYESEQDMIAAYSRQYSVSVPQRVKNMKILISYEDNLEEDTDEEEIIQGIVFSPDKTRYDMQIDTENKTISLSLEEASAGDWTINIIPKTLNIIDIGTENDKLEEDATLKETEFVIPEERENSLFEAEIISQMEFKDLEGRVYGNILSPEGRVYDMEFVSEEDSEKKKHYYIRYEIPFMEVGTYKVRIYYHPEEVTVNEPELKNNVETQTDVFVIQG